MIARQAELVARWLLVGFIHGVMNTDNTSISGETIDYGPCAFMDDYDPAQVFSSIDEMGRYAYANQPRIALWNLTRLAECLLPLFSDDQDKAIAEAQEILGGFSGKIRRGLSGRPAQQDRPVHGARRRRGAGAGPARCHGQEPGRLHADLPPAQRGRAPIPPAMPRSARCSPSLPPMTNGRRAGGNAAREEPQTAAERQAAMRAVNPAFIPRNHRVEAVIQAAMVKDDYAPFEELLAVLSKPYEDQPAIRGLCRAAAAGPARAADVLRDLKR